MQQGRDLLILVHGFNVSWEEAVATAAAFEAMVKDSAFLEEAAKRNLSITPRSAQEVQALAERVVGASPEFIAKVKQASGGE